MIVRDLDAVIRQWDSFFKEIAPHSAALRTALSEFLEINQDSLIPQGRLPTEYRSRAIASALHHKGIYKEFRLDGLYRTDGYPAFGFEYQTTYDSGVPLRTLMYEIAVREELPDLPERGGVQFVVLYSGRGIAKDLTPKLHGKRIAFFTSTIFVDLNELDRPSLLSSDLSSFVLALARHDANPDLFLSGIARIDKEGQSAAEIERLKKALVAAAIGKKDVLAALRELTMDAVIRESLASLREQENNQRIKDTLLTLAPTIQNAPANLSDLIEDWELSNIDSLANQLAHASETNDWSDLYSARPRINP